MEQGKFLAILRLLRGSNVDFVVVGGLAGVLHGAPLQTLDLDIVHSRDAANVERLLTVLASLDAVFRIQPERHIRPNASYVSGPGHLNLITRFGPLDVLGTIGRGLTYADLLADSVEMEIGEGMRARSGSGELDCSERRTGYRKRSRHAGPAAADA